MRLLILPIVLFLKAHFGHAILGMSLWKRPNGPQTGAANSASMPALSVPAQGNSALPALQVITATSETGITNPSQSSTFLQVTLPPNLSDSEQTPLDLVFSGYIKTTANGNLTLIVREGVSATLGSNTQVATSGAIAQNTATAPFEMHVHLVFDSVSGKMGGYFEGFINNTLVARAALSNVITGLTNSANPVLTFILSLTSSGAGAGTPTTINVQTASIG